MKIHRYIIVTNFLQRARGTINNLQQEDKKKEKKRRYNRVGFIVGIWELQRLGEKYVWVLLNYSNYRAVNIDKIRNAIPRNGMEIIYKKLPRNYFKNNKYVVRSKTCIPFSEKDLA